MTPPTPALPRKRGGRFQFGLGVQGDKSPEDYARLAQLAEQYGLDVLSVFSDLLYQPAIVPLTIAALSSTRLRLGPACLNPFTLHPTEIAGQIAMLDRLSGGRAYLGLARGAWLDRIGITPRRAVRALRETVDIVRKLLAADPSGYEGEIFSIAPGTALQYDVLRPNVPLLIGTWSPKTAALAGEVADEIKIGGTANPAMVRRMRDMIAVGTSRAGRSPDDVGIVIGAVTVVANDGEEARRVARSAVAMYLEVVGKLDPTTQTPGGEVISDDVLDTFAMSGTPENVAVKVQALFDAGARRVEFGSPYGLTMQDGVRLLGERVIPMVSR